MSTEKIILHLTQKLLNVNDKDILIELMNWIFKINFVDQNDKTFNVYANDERSNKWKLLKEMKLIKTIEYSLSTIRNSADIQLLSIHLVNDR